METRGFTDGMQFSVGKTWGQFNAIVAPGNANLPIGSAPNANGTANLPISSAPNANGTANLPIGSAPNANQEIGVPTMFKIGKDAGASENAVK